MMLPSTYGVALFLAILTMICWGSWANTLKLAGKWRFELYYFDYAIGVFLASLGAAFTFGSIQGTFVDSTVLQLSVIDNLLIASKFKILEAFAAGIIFNLANMLLVAAIAVAGLAVAFPVGIGLALIVGTALSFFLRPAGNPWFILAGVFLVLLAIIVSALAHAQHAQGKPVHTPPAAPTASRIVHRPPAGPPRKSAAKGIVLSLACGILMGLFYPLVEYSKQGDLGLGPYSAAVCFAVGVLLSTPFFNVVFMNVPVEGPPVPLRDYFAGTPKQHLLGLLGGIIWCTGAVSNFVAASAPPSVNIGPAISYALGQGATLISTLWGLLVWREFAGATPSVRNKVILMLILFIAGLSLLSVAPLYK
jgi:glucose uptake protein